MQRSCHVLLSQENDTSWESWDTTMDAVVHIIGYVLLLEQCLTAARGAVGTLDGVLKGRGGGNGKSIISSERSFSLHPIITLEHRTFIEDRLLNGFLSFHRNFDKCVVSEVRIDPSFINVCFELILSYRRIE